MKFRTTRQFQITALALGVLGGAVVVWWMPRAGDSFPSERHKSEFTKVSPTASPETPPAVKKAPQADAAKLAPTEPASATAKLTQEEVAHIEAQLGPVRQLLKKIDLANAVTEFDRQQDKARFTALRVKPPDAAQLSPLYDALTKAGRTFPKGSPAAKEFRRQADRLLRGLDAQPRLVMKSTSRETGDSIFAESVGGQFTVEANGVISITGDSLMTSRTPSERFQHLFPTQ